MPFHGEFVRHRCERLPESLRSEGEAVGCHLDAEEEHPRVEVAVLRRLEYRSTVAGDEPGNGSHNADAIWARDGEDETAHPLSLAQFFWRAVRSGGVLARRCVYPAVLLSGSVLQGRERTWAVAYAIGLASSPTSSISTAR
jgi:hypothetical protein